ncbi:MAG: hypothetical protein D6721_04580 [Gammaproteobacteria bacterium]|nr:MAG: hypothetical protein D6721_04580 [Gammaproteobacteria bacterium]
MRTVFAWNELERLPWPWPLVGWYADPIPRAEARRRLRTLPPARDPAGRLQAQLLAFWAEGPRRLHLEPLLATARGEAAALLQLVEGQLRMSVRLAGAMAALDRGFHQAIPFLGARDYFRVLRRHELLRRLPLAQAPVPPLPLDALLVEARLRGRTRAAGGRRDDTLG